MSTEEFREPRSVLLRSVAAFLLLPVAALVLVALVLVALVLVALVLVVT